MIREFKKVWTNIRQIVPGKIRNTDISCVKTGQSECTNSKDVADALNQYFANVGPSITDKIPGPLLKVLATLLM